MGSVQSFGCTNFLIIIGQYMGYSFNSALARKRSFPETHKICYAALRHASRLAFFLSIVHPVLFPLLHKHPEGRVDFFQAAVRPPPALPFPDHFLGRLQGREVLMVNSPSLPVITERIGNSAIADDILDRQTHNAHKVNERLNPQPENGVLQDKIYKSILFFASN